MINNRQAETLIASNHALVTIAKKLDGIPDNNGRIENHSTKLSEYLYGHFIKARL